MTQQEPGEQQTRQQDLEGRGRAARSHLAGRRPDDQGFRPLGGRNPADGADDLLACAARRFLVDDDRHVSLNRNLRDFPGLVNI
jgi:hypothetical protein